MLAATLPTAASLASGLASLLTGLPTLAALLPSGATAFPDLGRSDLLGSTLLATAHGTVAAVTGTLGALTAFFTALAVWAALLVAALSIYASQRTLFSALPTLAVFTLASGRVTLPIARATVRDTDLTLSVESSVRFALAVLRHPRTAGARPITTAFTKHARVSELYIVDFARGERWPIPDRRIPHSLQLPLLLPCGLAVRQGPKQVGQVLVFVAYIPALVARPDATDIDPYIFLSKIIGGQLPEVVDRLDRIDQRRGPRECRRQKKHR